MTSVRWMGAALAIASAACVGDSANPVPDAGSPVDASDASEAAVDAGPFSPAKLPGLLFWMDGSRGVTADGALKVSRWEDQSGLKNHANQPNPSLQPKLASNALAGHTTVEFPMVGNDANLDIGSPSKAFTADFFVEIVATTNLGPAETGQFFYAGNPSGNNAQILAENGKFEAGLFVSSTKFVIMPTNFVPNVPHLIFMRRAGTKFELGVDGTTLAVNDAPKDALTPLFRFGGPFAGQLAEVVGIDGVISTTDQSALEAYLKTKYAF